MRKLLTLFATGCILASCVIKTEKFDPGVESSKVAFLEGKGYAVAGKRGDQYITYKSGLKVLVRVNSQLQITSLDVQ